MEIERPTEREEVSRSKTGTASFAEFSKLTARMVELSLQEAQRERASRGPVPDKLSPVPSPLLWPATDVQATPERPADSAGRPGTGPAATPLTRPQRTEVIQQRTALLIGSWSRWATTAQFVAGRLSARLRILTNSQPLRRLRYGCRKNLCFLFAKPYRCRDCGKGVGFRSRPRTLLERYILPLTLMQPVCCAECSRRDYRLIFTPVRERSHHRDESTDPIHRDAA
jgi:hypothetical protein